MNAIYSGASRRIAIFVAFFLTLSAAFQTVGRICSNERSSTGLIRRSPLRSVYSDMMTSDVSNNPLVKLRRRTRRNRKSEEIRALVRENHLSPKDFIYPIFLEEDGLSAPVPISSMPGCFRYDTKLMLNEIKECMDYGVKSFILFPKINDDLKTNDGKEALQPNGLIPRAIRTIKEKFPEAIVIADIALDPYSSKGHDGIVGENGAILNDKTVDILQQQALNYARCGVDIVAPSDMMDGRIGVIRDALDYNGFSDVSILAYSAKYASSFYGPFRDALDSHPHFGDKKSYQQDPANSREAVLEAELDIKEGADMILVKPGMPYLDIIHKLKENFNVPVAAYQVSGEYSMIKAAAANGWLNEKNTVMESLMCFKRAGADVILTYFAKQAAKWLSENK